ncbi:MAG: right-handed parallel beta-helix repeat-containing protein [Lachnospiraceae bacterium]|nr:right-handed parallel beta-helix repeat-containing protein [Lachnospiraceae bacterium]
MRYRSLIAVFCSILLITGCAAGKDEAADTPDTAGADAAEAPAASASAKKEPAAHAADRANADFDKNLLGEWEFMCCTDSSSDSESSYFYMSDDEPIGGTISIYEDGQDCFADFEHYSYESSKEVYHIPLTIEKGALYPGCPNQDWYATFKNPHTDYSFSLALTGKNELVYYQENSYDPEEGEGWTNYSYETYVRKDSEEANNPDKYRYSNSVTVSTAKDLLDSISSNTVIKLKAGEYNLSEVSGGTLNRNVFTEVDKYSADLNTISVQIRNVSNLRIEPEDGAEVEICINDPYSPVLSLYDCSKVTFKGLKCGHKAEPGTCGGSVIYVHQSTQTTISECRLYGSGSYGVETSGGYGVYVNDTEIYDCTYGIASFYDTSDIQFTNCNMHDNKEFALLDFTQCYTATFTDCTFTHNLSSTGEYGAYPFVRTYEGGTVTFENCVFNENEYGGFSENDNVETINCKFNDNVLGFG